MQMDANLVDLWHSIPGKEESPTMITFPVPTGLSKGRTASSDSSVASGLTDASPVEDYFRTLEQNLTTKKLPAAGPFRNTWNKNLPLTDISYAFNTNEFPNLNPSDKTSKSTVTTAHDTTSFDPGQQRQ
jgi:hypothetical protein